MIIAIPLGYPGVTYVLDPHPDSMGVELRHLGKVLHVWTFREPRRLTPRLAEELLRQVPGLGPDVVHRFMLKRIGR